MLAECVQQRVARWRAQNVLPLSNEDAGLLVYDDRIQLISCTGRLRSDGNQASAPGRRKLLSHWRQRSVIVHSDADLIMQRKPCVSGGFGYLPGKLASRYSGVWSEHSVYENSPTSGHGVRRSRRAIAGTVRRTWGRSSARATAIRTVHWHRGRGSLRSAPALWRRAAEHDC